MSTSSPAARIFRFLIPVLIVLAGLFVAWLMLNSRAELVPQTPDKTLPRVQVEQVLKGDVSVQIRAQGVVSARQQLELASELTGKVVWVAPEFLSGEQVSAGQILLRMDPLDYQVALADARASLANAELSLADARALKRRAAMTEAQARIDAARQRVIQAKDNLADTEITAPFNAIVDRKLVELGQYLTPGRPVAQLLGTDLADIRVNVTAQDRRFLRAENNQPVMIHTAYGDMSWRGRIGRIEARVDDQTRVFPVVVEVEQPYVAERHAQPLSLGLFVETLLPGEPIADAVRVERNVVISGSGQTGSAGKGGNRVYVLEDGKLRARDVEIRHQDERGLVITEGLRDGDQLVVSRLDLMFDGMEVRVNND